MPGEGRDPHTGRFTQGNPGKPMGARNKATRLALSILEADADLIARSAVEQAVTGSVGAMKLCLERLVPKHRERTVEFDIGPIVTAADAARAAGRITELIAAGELSPAEGHALAAVIEVQRRALETAELERRILTLEGRPV